MAKKPINIVSIVPFPLLPVRSGGQQKTYQLLSALSERAKLNCITPAQEAYSEVPNFKVSHALTASKWRYLDFSAINRINELLEKANADLLMVDQPFWMPLAMLLKKATRIPLVLHGHNLEYIRFKSLGKPWWRVVEALERWAFSKADLLLFISEEDRQLGCNHFNIPLYKSMVVPFGNAQKSHLNTTTPEQAKEKLGLLPQTTLFFYGKLDYAPNEHAVKSLIESIYPLLKAKALPFQLLVAGGGLSEELQAQLSTLLEVQYLGYVAELEPYLQAADVVLNPVLLGGGVKTKVVEALAAGKPVVSTETGALGLKKSVCGNALVTVPDHDWAKFTDLCFETAKNHPKLGEDFFRYYYIGEIADAFLKRIEALLFLD